MHFNHKQQHQLQAQITNTSYKEYVFFFPSSCIKYDSLSHTCYVRINIINLK